MCKSVYLLERDYIKEDNVSSGLSIRASWEALANEKNIDSGSSVEAADNKLNNVNNTNHPLNSSLNKTGVNRTRNSK